MKVKSFILPAAAGTILVCGSSRSARVLFGRIKAAANDNTAWTIRFSLVPVKGYDYIYSTDVIPLEIARSCRETIVVPDAFAEGKTHSQECLRDTDWKAIRDIEQQLLAMDKAGIWNLPNDVKERMCNREKMRVLVDSEII